MMDHCTEHHKSMVQIADFWPSCCPCPAPWSKALWFPAARTSSGDDESTLLPPPPKVAQEAHGGDHCNSMSSMSRLSHLKGLDGEM